MHILHIVGSYGGTEVYKNLFSSLDQLGIQQTVFVPLNSNNHDRIGNHKIDFAVYGSKIIYSIVLNSYHRYLYSDKISVIVREIEKNIDLTTISIIHSATLCVDGAVAYELKKKYNIPYITAIRNTDISTYYKYFKWKHHYFSEIFDNASNIIFICPQYRKSYLASYISKNKVQSASQKSLIIPNGIDLLFLNAKRHKERKISDPIKIVFASAFVRNKGLREIVEAIALLRIKGYKITFEAIGKGLPFRKENSKYIDEINKLSQKYDWVVLRRFMEKKQLREAFSISDIFVMPSKPETFGLVYVEALSQGLPILYAKGEGFDGYFDEGVVGYSANAFNVDDIALKIEKIIQNYELISSNIIELDLLKMFSWKAISTQYYEIYKKVIENEKNSSSVIS